jgi:hypothetical protein
MGRLLLNKKMMKRNLLILLLLCAIVVLNVKAQIPCNHPRGIKSSLQLSIMLQNKPINIQPSDFIENCNITTSVRKRLTYLLRWQWTQAEINNYYAEKLVIHKNVYLINETANKIANGNDSMYIKAKDSIENAIIKRELEYDIKYNHLFTVPETLILVIGWLNMKETIPFLRDSALKDQLHYPKWAVELALARMGDKRLQKKIITSCKNDTKSGENFEADYYNKYRKILYLATQESLYQLHDFVDTSKYIEFNSAGALTSFAYRIVQDFSLRIGNEDLKKLIILTGDEYNYNIDAILAIKQWMIKNKKKYKIIKGFCPY